MSPSVTEDLPLDSPPLIVWRFCSLARDVAAVACCCSMAWPRLRASWRSGFRSLGTISTKCLQQKCIPVTKDSFRLAILLWVQLQCMYMAAAMCCRACHAHHGKASMPNTCLMTAALKWVFIVAYSGASLQPLNLSLS